MENVKRCDNCFFSIWMMSSNRPMLGCKQRVGSVGRYRIVQLEQSCTNFYPSGTFRASRRSFQATRCVVALAKTEDGKAGSKATRRIPLTKGKFALVDAEDYYRLAKFNWHAKLGSTTMYAARRAGGKMIKMHRLIMDAPSHLVVDHIDHNGLNNARSNLRLCTIAQNSRNMLSNNGSTSKYKGVCWHKTKKKWAATIQFNKKTYHLGHFEDEIDAAKAYDKKAKELFGEFAYLNFPSP